MHTRRRLAAALAAALALGASCSSAQSPGAPETPPSALPSAPAGNTPDSPYLSYGGPAAAPAEDCAWARPDDGWRCWVVELPETRAADGKAAWTWALMRFPLQQHGPAAGVMYVDLGRSPGHDDLASLPEWTRAKGAWLNSWYVFTVLPPGLDPGQAPSGYSSTRGLTEAAQHPTCPAGGSQIYSEDTVWTAANGPGDGFGRAASETSGDRPDMTRWPATELPAQFRWDSLADTALRWTSLADGCTGYDWRTTGPDYHSDLIELTRRALVGPHLPITTVFERAGTAAAAALVRKYPESVLSMVLVYPDLQWGSPRRDRLIDAAMAGWGGWRSADGSDNDGFAEWCIDQEDRCYSSLSPIGDLPPGVSAEPPSEDYLALWTVTSMLRRYPHKAASARLLTAGLADPAQWPELAAALTSVPSPWPESGHPARADDPDGDGLDELGRPVPAIPVYSPAAHISRGEAVEALSAALWTPGPGGDLSPVPAEDRIIAGWAYECMGSRIPVDWSTAIVPPGSRQGAGGALASSLSAWAAMSGPAAGAALEAFSPGLFGEWVEDAGAVRSGTELCDRMLGVVDPSEPEPLGPGAFGGGAVAVIVPAGRPDLFDPAGDPAARALLSRPNLSLTTVSDHGSVQWHDRAELCIDSAVRDFLTVGGTAETRC